MLFLFLKKSNRFLDLFASFLIWQLPELHQTLLRLKVLDLIEEILGTGFGLFEEHMQRKVLKVFGQID